MQLKDLLTAIGITVTEEQYGALASRVVLKTEKPQGKTGGTYSYLSSAFGPKTPTQMRTCVNVLMELGTATMEEWAKAAGDVLVTRQDPAKVIAFYRKRMLDEGLIVVGKGQSAAPVDEEEEEEEEAAPVDEDEEEEDFEEEDIDLATMPALMESFNESRAE